ncbi:UDP-glucose pyrophosphorylase 3 [Wolffia australiana]
MAKAGWSVRPPPSTRLPSSIASYPSSIAQFSWRSLSWSSVIQVSSVARHSRALRTVVKVSIAPLEQAPAPEFDVWEEISRLEGICSRLRSSKSLRDKIRVLDDDPRVKELFGDGGRRCSKLLSGLDSSQAFLVKCLVAAGQAHVLFSDVGGEMNVVTSHGNALKNALYVLADMIENWNSDLNGGGEYLNGVGNMALNGLLSMLEEVDHFYSSIGGIIGYQVMILRLLSQSTIEGKSRAWSSHVDEERGQRHMDFHVPNGLNLDKQTEDAFQAALWGIEGMPDLGEIYPLGGSGDRLGLIDPDTRKCLPAAMLMFCGRTLLEGLIRDLQAREFLYFKLYGKQCITPVAIMTSSAKDNHSLITSLCKRLEWFGRGRQNFQLFEQPLVPVVSAQDGRWLISDQFSPVCRPGGHGAIWKLAHDKGIFTWFFNRGRKGATIRQVSNVVAATDVTLLALAGIGLHHQKKLGFASCQRSPAATEGINVLVEKKTVDRKYAYGLTCIEYTEFKKFGITDGHFSPNSSEAELPANTNILYVDLRSAEKVGSSKSASSLPGMVLNLKKPVQYVDYLGIKRSVPGGRLECTMQSIAENFLNVYHSRKSESIEEELDTFIVYNQRRRVTSSAKKKRRQNDSSLHQTPDGALLDILRNAFDLLSVCHIEMPKIKDNSEYLYSGPPFLILLHPALGPLWDVTRQKFHGGSISEGSELQLEVAEFLWRDVQLDGSLIILADNIMGSMEMDEHGQPLLQYGFRCGRCKLQNVRVINEGIDWSSPKNIYWKNDVQRVESARIVLHGNAEFEAADVTIHGSHVFEVPDGFKMRLGPCTSGFKATLHPLGEEGTNRGSWFWKYNLDGARIRLEIVDNSSAVEL